MPETSILTIQPLHGTAFRPLVVALAAFLLASSSISMAQPAPAPGASEAPAGLATQEPAAPPRTAAQEAFLRGVLARAGWEDWLAGLPADARAGAMHWTQRHRGNEAGVCRQLRRASRPACEEAGRRRAEVEQARQGSPDFRLGWSHHWRAPYREALLNAAESCWAEGRERGESATFLVAPGAIITQDFNGDGVADVILDNARIHCRASYGEIPAFCGSGGCGFTIWASSPTGYRVAFNGSGSKPRITRRGRTITLTAEVHHSDCDYEPSQRCLRHYRWNGTEFQEPGR